VTFDTEEGFEIRLRHGGSLSREVLEHLNRAGGGVLLVLGRIAGSNTCTHTAQELTSV